MEGAGAAAWPPVTIPSTPWSRLLHDGAFYTGSGLFTRALGLALVPLVTHHLEPEAYGLIAVTLVIAAILGMPLTMAFHVPLCTLWPKVALEERTSLISTAFFATWFSSMGVSCLVLTAGPIAAQSTGVVAWSPWGWMALAIALAGALGQVPASTLQAMGRARRLSLIQALSAVTSSGLIIVLVIIVDGGPLGYLSAVLIASSLSTVIMTIAIADRLAFTFSLAHLRSMLPFSLPAIVESSAASIQAGADRAMLQAAGIPIAAGHYAVASQCSVQALGAVSAGMATAWAPIYHASPVDDRSTTGLVLRYSMAMAILGMGVALPGKAFLDLVLPASYLPATRLLPILAMAGFFMSLWPLLQQAHFRARTPRRSMLTVCLGAGTAVLLHGLLIPRWGAVGAAIALVIGALVLPISGWALLADRQIFNACGPRLLLITLLVAMSVILGVVLPIGLAPLAWLGLSAIAWRLAWRVHAPG